MILDGVQIGIGTWAWGDRLVWQYGTDYEEDDLRDVFRRALQDDIQYFAVSESFGEGKAETLLSKFETQFKTRMIVSTKYVSRPWRFRHQDFMEALKDSLRRLNRNTIELYEFMPPSGPMKLEKMADYAAEALDLGLIKNIGVSNFTLSQLDRFTEAMKRFGYPVTCLETEYNLLERSIETNGILRFCEDTNIRLVAQNPLAMGYLTGKYDAINPASGNRRQLMRKYCTPALNLLIRTMNNIGMENNGQNCAQVSLNWLICKGVIPIPGAKRVEQAIENNSVGTWRMTDEQFELLNNVSRQVQTVNSQ